MTELKERFWSKVNKNTANGCWEWTASLDRKGYGQITVKKGLLKRTHRVAWELIRGSIPEGQLVCHHCDNKKCVNPDHLFLGTQRDNVQDMDSKGRRVNTPHYGEQHGMAKLTNAQVKRIKEFLAVGIKRVELAKTFNIGYGTISHIAKGRQWKTV